MISINDQFRLTFEGHEDLEIILTTELDQFLVQNLFDPIDFVCYEQLELQLFGQLFRNVPVAR